MTEKETFYKNLKEKLENNTKFPSDFLYKFIVPTTKNQVSEITHLFDNKGAVLTTKNSKTGKYTSVSVLLKVKTADEVIINYKAVEHIDGLISL